MLRDDFGGKLVLAQPFERACPNHAVGGPSRELDLSDQLGLQPVYTRLMARGVLTFEGTLVDREFLQPWKNLANNAFAEAGANASGIDEAFIAIDSRKQRAEAAAFAGPPAE